MLNYITPLTIAPSVTMIGLALFESAAQNASGHWGIAIGYVIVSFDLLWMAAGPMGDNSYILQ